MTKQLIGYFIRVYTVINLIEILDQILMAMETLVLDKENNKVERWQVFDPLIDEYLNILRSTRYNLYRLYKSFEEATEYLEKQDSGNTYEKGTI
ncbi:MAG: hypothetical protein QXS29_10060 [Nitrososphaeria archaeon]